MSFLYTAKNLLESHFHIYKRGENSFIQLDDVIMLIIMHANHK